MLFILAAFCGVMALVCGAYGFTGMATVLRRSAQVLVLIWLAAAVIFLIIAVA